MQRHGDETQIKHQEEEQGFILIQSHTNRLACLVAHDGLDRRPGRVAHRRGREAPRNAG